MKAGCKQKYASPLADILAFRMVKNRLGDLFTSGMEFEYDTIVARVQDNDPEKYRYDEYCFAGGLVEYVKWLNADKQPLHDILSFRKEATTS
ncbi:hypothetical protein L2E82_48724 [Cichorium intybus]|uniref:Uncharacterized protein n=1 Tax=Cichorium intybus TaxID=13427 RepID=A0ACB8YXW0_CICIN|nr:hypothetical protein L2E82_48724 [Cichorium intybus]